MLFHILCTDYNTNTRKEELSVILYGDHIFPSFSDFDFLETDPLVSFAFSGLKDAADI